MFLTIDELKLAWSKFVLKAAISARGSHVQEPPHVLDPKIRIIEDLGTSTSVLVI